MLFELFTLTNLLPFVLSKIESDCTQFSVDKSSQHTFEWYRLYDFRNVYTSPLLPALNFAAGKRVADDSWRRDWYVRDYPRKSPGGTVVPVDFRPDRVKVSMYLLPTIKRQN